MNIAILGGSFSPIHIGHLWAAQQAREMEEVDQVWLMPNKGAKHWGKNLIESIHRHEMCRLAVKDFGVDFLVSDLEIWKEFEWTYQTIDLLVSKQPDHQFFWIVGSDWDYKRFKNYETLKDDCKFIVVDRDGKNSSAMNFKLSSTLIRQRIKDKKKITGLVTKSVEEYISEKGLFV